MPEAADWAGFREGFSAIEANVCSVIRGKPREVRLALVTLIADGHLLIEDVPGVGKTMLAKAIARSIDCSFQRIQFTPDLLPIDVTGVNVFSQEHGDFDFRPGPIFSNIVLADEINRGSPKTQSALLECMEERQVTVDGVTRPLARPFMVLATQNPIEHEGTYPLPEAQLDRFTLRLAMGYPSPDDELDVLETHGISSALDSISPVTDAAGIVEMMNIAKAVHAAPSVRRYVIDLAGATRAHPDLYLGASPRASIMLLRAGRAMAAAEGRDFVIPDDIKALAPSVFAHRLLPGIDATMSGRTLDVILQQILEEVPVPVTDRA